MSKDTLSLKVVTPKGGILLNDAAATFVKVQGITGEVGILSNHSPAIIKLKTGELQVKINGQDNHYFVPDGFAHITQESVVVLTTYVEKVSEIDKLRAEKSKARAEKRLQDSETDKGIDVERAKSSLHRSEIRLALFLSYRL